MVRWDSAADARLFLAVLKVHGLKLNYEAIAKEMGDNCTPKAISHRISKLKDLGNGRTSVTNTPSKSPTKRKRVEEDLMKIKKEQFEPTNFDDDVENEGYVETADVANGSPKKRKRQTKVAAAVATTSLAVPAPLATVAPSFASTEFCESFVPSPIASISSEPSTSVSTYDAYDADWNPGTTFSYLPEDPLDEYSGSSTMLQYF